MSLYDPDYRRDRPAARLGMTLLRIGQAVKKLSQDEAEELGLTPVQAQTLLFIRHTKSFLASIGRLAEALGTTHVTALGVVDNLVRRGLVVKAPAPFDRRISLLRLTPEGERVTENLENFGNRLELALAELDAGTLVELEHHLGAVVWSLRAGGLLQVAEPCRGCVHFEENVAPGSTEPHRCRLIRQFLSETESHRNCPDFTPTELPVAY